MKRFFKIYKLEKHEYFCRVVAQSDPCDPNPCANSGTCNVDPADTSAYNCACATGYDGTNCDNGK